MIPVYNNSNFGYLMYCLDGYDDVFGGGGVDENTLGESICTLDNCCVSWKLGTRRCIEYGIKKLYLQECDEIEQVGVYCEEVIDCVEKEME